MILNYFMFYFVFVYFTLLLEPVNKYGYIIENFVNHNKTFYYTKNYIYYLQY